MVLPKKTPSLASLALGFAAASIVLACTALGQGGTQKTPGPQRPTKLSVAQKRVIVAQKSKLSVGGLTDYAQVNLLQPIVEGKAWLSLSGAGVNFEEGHTALSGFSGRYNMTIKVIRPGKIHLVTFYLNNTTDQTLRIEAKMGGFAFASDMLAIKAGPKTASLVFTPEKTGRCGLTLFAPHSPYTYYVYSAECTVVD